MSDQNNGRMREEQGHEMQTIRNFNPNEHLVQLKSKQGTQDYLPVQWRLVWFRSECPHGTIDTEEIEVDLDRMIEAEAFAWNAEKRRSEKVVKQAKGYARFRATITDGKGGRATGTGSEAAADFADFIEKAETKAIGRALAALGYGTQFAPELAESHRIVDAPVDFGNNGTHNGNGNGNGNGYAPATAPLRSASSSNGNGSHPSGENESETNATEQQISSIRKLCTHLGKTEPENVSSISFLAAKKLLQQLTAEYKEQRQNSKAS